MLSGLVNWAFYLSLVLGALFFVLIQHLTRAGWSVVVRRMAEVEAVVIENNVTDFVLAKARISEKAVSFDELMAQQG